MRGAAGIVQCTGLGKKYPGGTRLTREDVLPPILHAAEVTGVTEMGARTSFTFMRSLVALLRYSTSASLRGCVERELTYQC